jgi:hypothetical protein
MTPIFVVFGSGRWTSPISMDSETMNKIGTGDFRKCFLFYF